MAYDVDVVVIGGASAAVTAAVAAAEAGATVFLAAPRPYLGEDLCATYRLWLEDHEEPTTPLAQAMFKSPRPVMRVGESMPFTYRADLPSDPRHPDASPPSRLADGRWD
ncbi:MAG TPA: FAD-dependent oxidoreductase, partial [Candidatus Hydrogenedentes bacterium]|nr:FAD-dependent oxidoreductase [Candidatus Hydrogenedentota bacterium]